MAIASRIQPLDSLILLAQSDIDKRYTVCVHTSPSGQFQEILEDFTRLCLMPCAGMGVTQGSGSCGPGRFKRLPGKHDDCALKADQTRIRLP